MPIFIKRAYDTSDPQDGVRVLVDRLWPRGIKKSEAMVDEWLKEAAPTKELRKAYHSGQLDWADFRIHYLAHLKQHREELRGLADRAHHENITLLFSSKNRDRNNAEVMRQYLHMLQQTS